MLASAAMELLDRLRSILADYGAIIVWSGGALALIAWLRNALGTGVATLMPITFRRDEDEPLTFSRDLEPREYWALVILAIVALLVVLWSNIGIARGS